MIKNIWTLFKREITSLFLAPIAYVLMFVFLLIQGYTFWILVSAMNNPGLKVEQSVIQLFFGGTFFFWISIILVASVVTMRLLSEEKKNGTFELLMTAPVRLFEVVLGKYCAACFFYFVLWLPTFLFVSVLVSFSSLEWGPILTGYLGIFLLGCLFMALGLFASSLTENQIVSAVLCFGLSLLFFSLSFLEFYVEQSSWGYLFNYVNLLEHMNDFGKGILDIQVFIYYGSLIAFFLFFSIRVLQFQRE